MNHFMYGTAPRQAAPSRFPFKKLLGGALLGAALAAAPAAQADVITFENYVNNLVGDSDYFDEAGVRLTGFSNAPNGQPGDFVGAIFDGSDRGACGNLACPVNNQSAYYAALNDGILQLDQLNGNYVSVRGFDASFIGAAQGVSYPAVSGLLRVQGFYADGSSVYETYQLGGPIGGSFQFQHFDTSASFGNQQFNSVAFFGFTCNTTGNCNAFSSNKGQFALDNIVVSVPEPSTYAMLLLGLAGIGAVARRRNRRQATSTLQAHA
ncbi:NF038120 family PEP-CTERM protein [Janthinobacterium agaricidamnosum]|uniref:PEP-CTERM putative exosortase interaction domain protein n=1 Tax=Janthinobacterium agaricidamnosum NBRC 102515 = DSM 9628 TaxID=1349767 RepID=W0V9L7_9BURK|nr:NF038120 family PEP-CTERM protein [Janthinobacterium agaricidamnosum]CDG84586.1 PEP-CTERM putative exosortase interaction domain protein [Janthinobacterium agaricidamnosum NBRC 102515 = DSM 9628]